VVEVDAAGVAQEIRQSRVPASLVISNSQNIQIGNGNVITIQDALQQLRSTIEQIDAPEPQKQQVRSLLESITHNPLVCAVVGGVVGGLTSSQAK
jgi:hypothetical protein